MNMTSKEEIQRYLQTGDYEENCSRWRVSNIGGCARQASAALKNALIEEIKRRDKTGPFPIPPSFDSVSFTRSKVAPMVWGLFRQDEQEVVLAALERSVIFLTPSAIFDVIREVDWPHTAWALANLYLASIGVKLLGPDAPRIVGFSEGTTCYVSTEYFHEADRFADFVIHEAAHVFHNCKRYVIGLPENRSCEWLLDIEFRKRETFAYACEAYGRILEHGKHPTARRALLAELTTGPMPSDKRVDAGEYLDILSEAVAARNGWKRILARCGRSAPHLKK